MAGTTMAFIREHGVLKDVYKESATTSHRTAKGLTVRTSKAPGFGPVGILRYVLLITVFLKLRDIGQKVLPAYDESFMEVAMQEDQEQAYRETSMKLVTILKQAVDMKDSTLLGVVMNVQLAWPDCSSERKLFAIHAPRRCCSCNRPCSRKENSVAQGRKAH
jgi:hypothetical protein